MKNYLKLLIVPAVLMLLSMKGDKPAYKLYTSKGKEASYKELLKDASAADMVFFGELHNNSICHWLQLELTMDLFEEKQEKLVLGAEMFEKDNQLLLDEYLSGKVAERNFEAEAKLWNNYKTDYKPLVKFAKDHNLPFIATNIPRRYAAIVNKKGFEGLEELEKEGLSYIAPLPVDFDPDVPSYRAMMAMMRGSGMHDTLNLAKAQAIKDATMANSILENWSPGQTFLHYNGAYHSDDFEGIVWWLKKEKPELKILTISTVEQDTIISLKKENEGKADYILCVPATMTKTYISTGP